VTEFIDTHLDQQLSLADLARTVSLSQYHFARRFRGTTGTTPHRFVTDRRVARAERLLKRSALPISVVASSCGFSDQSHLARIFKQRFGVTPREARVNLSP
jgi:AraC family transcriptional regulator